jgi:Leucine-rich repeat (LRR) protein
MILIMLLIILTVLPTLSWSQAVVAEATEAQALLKWKNSFDNQSQTLLSTWKNTTNPCNNWQGITCDKKSNSISTINLENLGLKGTLHSLPFSSFPNLITLNIYNNHFYGTIPPQIGNMSKINVLNFSLNPFDGSIPQEMCTLKTLQKLDLSQCKLSGAIPSSIGNLSNLFFLDLGTNNFSNSIPPEIGN